MSNPPVVITTNEPRRIINLFTNRLEVPMNFDFMLYTKSGTVGIERKKVPGDLLSSIDDGRLRREILAMREECDYRIVLLHGVIRYHKDGTVYVGKRRRTHWTEKGIKNICRTLEYVEGCYIERARNDRELVSVVNNIQEYFDKSHHLSMKGRMQINTNWIVPTKGERVIHFYQGIYPRIGPIGAKKLYDKFPNPIDMYQASVEDISSISGFGKKTATDIYNFLRGIE